jgi:ApaG protein|tara:strand:+ start:3382 stop:3753 length:372 start_codon:yes stop_codon:yes gene_type:complete
VTDEIEVSVVSQFLEDQSAIAEERYVFGYRVTITNQSSQPSQLLNRHWIITDGGNQVEEVRGPGVIGEQPWLQPGETFCYSSGAILKTPVGSMQGSYEFQNPEGQRFDVPIPPFSLIVQRFLH